jgi:hypothetical protein
MPLVVRWVGREADGVLSTALADALIEVLAVIHLRACEPTHVRALADADRAGLVRYGRPTIPLLRLPTDARELDRLEPLLRGAVLVHYGEPARDPTPERAALAAARDAMTAEDR